MWWTVIQLVGDDRVQVSSLIILDHNPPHLTSTYEACPGSKDTKVLNMYNIFNLQKRHCELIACT
jgi:hypothetical protein